MLIHIHSKPKSYSQTLLYFHSQLHAHWGAEASQEAHELHILPLPSHPLPSPVGYMGCGRDAGELGPQLWLLHSGTRCSGLWVSTAGPVSHLFPKLHLPIYDVGTEPCSSTTTTSMDGRRQKDSGSLDVTPWGLGTDLKPTDFPSTDHKHLLAVNCVLMSGGPVRLSGSPTCFWEGKGAAPWD